MEGIVRQQARAASPPLQRVHLHVLSPLFVSPCPQVSWKGTARDPGGGRGGGKGDCARDGPGSWVPETAKLVQSCQYSWRCTSSSTTTSPLTCVSSWCRRCWSCLRSRALHRQPGRHSLLMATPKHAKTKTPSLMATVEQATPPGPEPKARGVCPSHSILRAAHICSASTRGTSCCMLRSQCGHKYSRECIVTITCMHAPCHPCCSTRCPMTQPGFLTAQASRNWYISSAITNPNGLFPLPRTCSHPRPAST